MTACVNKKHTRRVALAISASLVGALSLGAAATPVFAQGGIETLVNQGDPAYGLVQDGEITEAEDEVGNLYTGDQLKDIKFAADGEAHYVTPTKVTIAGEDYEVGDEVDGHELKVAYYEAGGSEELPSGDPVTWISNGPAGIVDPGTYYAAFYLDGITGAQNVLAVKFEISKLQLEDAYVCEVKTPESDSITYDGAAQQLGVNIGLAVDGVLLQEGEDYASTDRLIYVKGDAQKKNVGWPVDAGDYVLEVKLDMDDDDMPETLKAIDFTIDPVDLATATLEYNGAELYDKVDAGLPKFVTKAGDVALNPAEDANDGAGVSNDNPADNGNMSSIHGTKSDIVLTYTGDPYTAVTKGEYTFRVDAYKHDTDEASPNFTGSREVTFVRYQNKAEFTYRNAEIDGNPTIFDFDASQVKAYDKLGAGRTEIPVEIFYYEDKDGDGEYETAVTADEAKTPGKYKALATAVDSAYTYGGEQEIFFEVAATPVASDQVYVRYAGEIVKAGESVDVYSGEDLLPNLTIDAKDYDGNPVDPSEFDVKVTKKGSDEALDKIVDAGDYTISVKSKDGSMYEIDNNGDDTLDFTVDSVEAVYGDVQTGTDSDNKPVYGYLPTGNAQLRFDGTMTYGSGKAYTYLYTGEAVVPTFEYDLITSIRGYDKAEDWKALPEDAYKATYEKQNAKTGKWEKVDECVEPGTYRVTLTDARANRNVNVDFQGEFVITKTAVFADVANDQWYSEWVYQAATYGYQYMTGINGTEFFRPDASITRGDVAVVLYKMAGGKLYADSEEGKDAPAKEFDTPFSDVDESLYYAQAIQWAEKVGIVTGYDGTDEFRPESSISRQELATMLYRYAKYTMLDAADASDDLSALDAYSDGASVADFADEAVAWAVNADVMGQNVDALRPTDAITRAEVAAMAVRVQPDGKLDPNDFIR